MVMGVEGGGGGVEMAGSAGVGEGYGVNIHVWWAGGMFDSD